MTRRAATNIIRPVMGRHYSPSPPFPGVNISSAWHRATTERSGPGTGVIAWQFIRLPLAKSAHKQEKANEFWEGYHYGCLFFKKMLSRDLKKEFSTFLRADGYKNCIFLLLWYLQYRINLIFMKLTSTVLLKILSDKLFFFAGKNTPDVH
jgi:hypothetical protein